MALKESSFWVMTITAEEEEEGEEKQHDSLQVHLVGHSLNRDSFPQRPDRLTDHFARPPVRPCGFEGLGPWKEVAPVQHLLLMEVARAVSRSRAVRVVGGDGM